MTEDDAFSFCHQLPESEAKQAKLPWMETIKSLVPTVYSGKVARLTVSMVSYVLPLMNS